MIDAPSATPAEQVIAQKMVACGLDRGTISVTYQDELQSIEIVVRRDARASAAQFACIHEAAGYEIVTFEDNTLRSAYSDYTTELYRPRAIAEAKASLVKLGLLAGFPKRSHYTDLRDYAAALERHCGLRPGSVLRVSGDFVDFNPPRTADFAAFERKYRKILAAAMYAAAIGDLKKFGFIGNEAITTPGE